MIHKAFLATLLISATFIVYGQNLDAQIQELKNDRYKKQLELSELGKKIAEKDELLESMWEAANNVALKILEKKRRSSEEQAVEDHKQAMNTSLENFKKVLDEAIIVKKNVKQFFIRELLREDKLLTEDRKDFETKNFVTLKFYVIRNALERDIMRALVEQYEECQQELIEIDQKLADLQKKTTHN